MPDANDLLQEVVTVARAQVGVRESGGKHRGKEVDQYIRSIGLDPTKGAYAWCYCMVYWIYEQASQKLGLPNPLPKTAVVCRAWVEAEHSNTCSQLVGACPAPGAIFLHDSEPANTAPLIYHKGHCGIVMPDDSGKILTSIIVLPTVEGDTDPQGSREGYGAYERNDRTLDYFNLGFIIPKAIGTLQT